MLQRHSLVWLSAAGWEYLIAGAHAASVLDCLTHWRENRLPLVVTRQERGCNLLALGLSAPLAWGRQKIPLKVPPGTVLYHDSFPSAPAIAGRLPAVLRPSWQHLTDSMTSMGIHARVHGSYGWQTLTGHRYLTSASDIDLLLPVRSIEAADVLTERLACFDWCGPRIDGELIFPEGEAVAWREWLRMRSGAVHRIMVKREDGVTLEEGVAWLKSTAALA